MSKKENKPLSINETASNLSVSTATVRNWIKHKYLTPIIQGNKLLFDAIEVESLKTDIAKGRINRLTQRANKGISNKTFIPEEYLENKNNVKTLSDIIFFIKENKLEINRTIFLLTVNLLIKKNILLNSTLKQIVSFDKFIFKNKQAGIELKKWFNQFEFFEINEEDEYLLKASIPDQNDILGLIYQSLLVEGKKAQIGSYYTPLSTVNDIADKYFQQNIKILDPCCGTGQFLLAFAEKTKNPCNLYGFEVDKTAVQIARLNLIIKFRDIDFIPNIYLKNTLLDSGYASQNIENSSDNFGLITTNPPWGMHFPEKDINQLREIYPEITSFESYSFFLKKCIDLLDDNGILSFILPESILNVKKHKDIRKYILCNTQIEKITYLGKIFKNVFSPVIRMDLQKTENIKISFSIQKKNISHKINQERFWNNKDYIFDIHINETDDIILNKIFNINHTSLKGKADWALGIVTGNNAKYISQEKKEGYEEVIKGKDIERFTIKQTDSYILFEPEKFQQVAPEYKYRANEKLVYRFISKYLIFAYDDRQLLTLNSANIVIPRIENYPIKVILALFNSSLYQFIFQKKFASIKILRSHIEHLPLPLWDRETFNRISELVNNVIIPKYNIANIDDYIMEKFLLNNEEIEYIKKSI